MAVTNVVTTKSMGNVDLQPALDIQAKTKEIIAQNNAAKAAAEQAAAEAGKVETPENPIDNAQSDIEEATKPVDDAVSFMDRFRQRQEEEYKREKERETARLALERTGRDFAGLAAVIGDTIRAHEGAPVSQRDWQQIYDNLTAQERANVNNYQVRMQKLRDDARADRMAQAQAKAKAVSESQKRQYDWTKWMTELSSKLSEAEKERILKYILSMTNAKARVDAAKQRTSGKSSQYTTTMLGETSYQVPKGDTFKNYVYSVLSVLDDEASYKDNKKTVTITQDETLETDPFGFYNKNIINILRNHWDDLTVPAKRKIEASILGHGGIKGNTIHTGDDGWNGSDDEYDD